MKRTDDPPVLEPGWRGTVRAIFILVTLTIVTLILLPFQAAFLRWWPEGARTLPHYYHRFLARLLGMRVIVQGAPVADGPSLIVANHVSWLDIVALSAVAPLSFVAKSEVNGWPIFGTLARLQRTVFVVRERRSKAGQSRDEIAARLSAHDRLVLFPEGTSTDGLRVRNFKSALLGAAEIEIEGRVVTVQPLTIAYTGFRGLPMPRWLRPAFAWYGDMDLAPHLWFALQLGKFEVTIELHEPLTVTSSGSRKALAAEAERRVRAGLVSILNGVPARRQPASGLDVAPRESDMVRVDTSGLHTEAPLEE